MCSSITLNKLYVFIIILVFAVNYIVYVNFPRYGSKWLQKHTKNKDDTKYILLWTPQQCYNCGPFDGFGEGRYGFKRINCPYSNCYITTNRSMLGDYTKFDAILFNGRPIIKMGNKELPERRNSNQLYVFVQLESADRFPVCNKQFDNFFNRTFTYRLDSDFLWPYVEVRNVNNDIIGPRVNMTWIKEEDMLPVSETFGEKLKKKKSAAAWFVSNCQTRSKREGFVKQLQKELARYHLTVDIYGQCGKLTCPRRHNLCERLLENTYYFYLAFENSFSRDYVTEKVLNGLLHDAVPVVYGGANYTRFLPNGSYIDARHLGATMTAQSIHQIMNNHTRYQNMFRWKQHYKFTALWPPPLCSMCEQLHKPIKHKLYKNFRKWWYSQYNKRC